MKKETPRKIDRKEAIACGLNRYDGVCRKHGPVEFYTKPKQAGGSCVMCVRCHSYKKDTNGKPAVINRVRRKESKARKWLVDNFLCNPCQYCREQKPIIVMQVDHKIPVGNSRRVSRNGIEYMSASNREGNVHGKSVETIKRYIKEYHLVPACADCNFAKAKTLDKGTPEGKREWRRYLREVRKQNTCGHSEKNRRCDKDSVKRKSSGVRH